MGTVNHPRKWPSAGTRAIVLASALLSVAALASAAPSHAAIERAPASTQNICTLLPYWPGCPPR